MEVKKMKNSKLLFVILIVVCFSCVKNKNYNQNTNFDVLEFITNYKFDNSLNDSVFKEKIYLDLSKESETKGLNNYVIYDYGDFFNNKSKYLIVWDQLKNNHYWFKKEKNNFVYFFKKEENILFIKDTIFDINNDGTKELIITNQTTGPNVSTVYFIDKNGLIDENLKIVASFMKIDNDKFIQVSNHSSPIVSFSKCKWNKTKIDTIENLFYDYNNNSKFYISKQYPFMNKENEYVIDNSKEVTTINKLPIEYQQALKKYDFNLYQNLKKVMK